MHQVQVNYLPDGGMEFGESEILNFEKEKTAREFAARQENIPQVLSAIYLGRKP